MRATRRVLSICIVRLLVQLVSTAHSIRSPGRAWCLVPGWRDPPELRGQRRGYRALKFAADCLELPLHPGHALWRQGGTVYLLMRCLQQRPDAQQPAWRLDPAGSIAGRLADDDREPLRRGSVVLRLLPAFGVWPLYGIRVPADGSCRQGRSSHVVTARSRPAVGRHSLAGYLTAAVAGRAAEAWVGRRDRVRGATKVPCGRAGRPCEP